jgi:DNA helicase II / ATP-dependent DNA helicase PcrA
MNEFDRAYKSLNSLQKKAVDNIEGPMLVIAGPGTGKTQLLSTRVANILKKTDTDASSILCLTFTEAGSSNMRNRLHNMIGKEAYNVNINTYHGFGNELIRDYSSYFPNFEISRPAEPLILDKIIRQIQTDLAYSNPLKTDAFTYDIKKIISNAKREFMSPSDILEKAELNLAYLNSIKPILDKSMESFDRISAKTITLFSDFLKKVESINSTDQELHVLLTNELGEALDYFHETKSTKLVTKWKSDWLEKNSQNKLQFKAIEQNKKIIAFADIYSKYENIIRDKGIYDYDDMIGLTLTALQNNDDFRFNIQEKYQYILLDEFQDTNGAQFKLVEMLTNNEIFERRPNIMAVGDDDQAIFSFQGANYSHMANFLKLYDQVVVINLLENYRSTQEILNFADNIGSQIQERLKIDDNFTKRLSAQGNNKKTVIRRVQLKSAISEYGFIANEVSRLIKNGVRPNEIAIIGKKHDLILPIIPYLHSKGIKIKYDKRDNILDDPIINILISMAKLVLALKNNKSQELNELWPEVLSADFFEIPTSLIWKLSWQAYDDRKQWRDILIEEEKTKNICLFFYRLALISNQETLETMFDYLIGTTPLDIHEEKVVSMSSKFYDYYFSEKNENESPLSFWQLLQNLSVLRDRLRDYSANVDGGLKLEDLIDYIEDNKRSKIRITNSSPIIESDNAVVLSTAHSVKGLEFECVFILDALENVWGSKAKNETNKIILPPTLEALKPIGTNDDERIRLFYVAMTRAKHTLIIADYEKDNSNKDTTRLKYLDEYENEAKELINPYLPENNQVVENINKELPTIEEIINSWQTRHLSAAGDIKMKHLLRDRLDNFKLSPTNVNKFTNVERGGPREFLLESLLRFPKAKAPSAEFGTAIHSSLEWLYKQADINDAMPSQEKLLSRFNHYLDTRDISEQERKLLRDRGEEKLKLYLKQATIDKTKLNLSEVTFAQENVFVGDAHLTGKIDKLIIDPKTKTATIVDYKTGKSHTKWTSEVKMHNYEQQLYFYKLMLENSRTYRKYKVTSACLEFVEADNENRINRLFIDFNDDKEDYYKKLIEAVYKKIITLDLPDISKYKKSLAGVQQFEKDLIDNK